MLNVFVLTFGFLLMCDVFLAILVSNYTFSSEEYAFLLCAYSAVFVVVPLSDGKICFVVK